MTPRKRQEKSALVVGVGVGVGIAAAAAIGYAIVKSKQQRGPVALTQWKRAVAADSPSSLFNEALEAVGDKGVDLSAKPEAWPYLLGLFTPDMDQEARQAVVEGLRGRYSQLLGRCKEYEVTMHEHTEQQQQTAAAGSSGGDQQPAEGQQQEGGSSAAPAQVPVEVRRFWEAQRIIVMDAVRTDFHKAALTTSAAITSWLAAALADSQLYQRLTAAGADDWGKAAPWLSSLARHHLQHTTHFSSDQKRQVVRLITLLSAYAAADPETGYCQGMSDLALPFLLLLEDDALAFGCFERLMRKVRRHFQVDEVGIFARLSRLSDLLRASDPALADRLASLRAGDCHFAYRMVVVLMRRELPLEQALRLWEMIWADDILTASPPAAAAGGPSAEAAAEAASDAPAAVAAEGAAAPAPPPAPASAGAETDEQEGQGQQPGEAPAAATEEAAAAPPMRVPSVGVSIAQAAATAAAAAAGGDDAAEAGSSGAQGAPAAGKKSKTKKKKVLPYPGSPRQEEVDAGYVLLSQKQQQQEGAQDPGSAAAAAADAPPPATADAVAAGAGDPSAAAAAAAADPAHQQPEGEGKGKPEKQGDDDEAGMGLFLHFVAAVVIGQRARVMDECQEADDLLKLFHSPLGIDVHECMRRARLARQQLLQAQAQ